MELMFVCVVVVIDIGGDTDSTCIAHRHGTYKPYIREGEREREES